jgi:hypothetical protein
MLVATGVADKGKRWHVGAAPRRERFRRASRETLHATTSREGDSGSLLERVRRLEDTHEVIEVARLQPHPLERAPGVPATNHGNDQSQAAALVSFAHWRSGLSSGLLTTDRPTGS